MLGAPPPPNQILCKRIKVQVANPDSYGMLGEAIRTRKGTRLTCAIDREWLQVYSPASGTIPSKLFGQRERMGRWPAHEPHHNVVSPRNEVVSLAEVERNNDATHHGTCYKEM